MIVGIVGSEEAKFTLDGKQQAKALIAKILSDVNVTGFTSGHCHLGGIDIWAEELAFALNIEPFIFPPRQLMWESYRERNLQIANKCDVLHNITVDKLPPDYKGMRFANCYHCNSFTHVKSGGCWTAREAEKLGKQAVWHIIFQGEQHDRI